MPFKFKYGFALGCLFIFFHNLHPQSFVFRHLDLKGNAKTKTSVFLREIEYTFGDTITNIDSLLPVFQKRYSSLNLFNYITVAAKHDTLFIEVVEKFYTWAKPMLQWADRNFNVWWQTKDFRRLIYGGTIYFNNIKGLNRQAYVTLIQGYNQHYEVGYQTAFNQHSRGWSVGAKAIAWSNHELWYTAIQDTLRFLKLDERKIQNNKLVEISLRHRFNYFTRLELTAGFSHIKLDSSIQLNEYIFGKSNSQKEFFQKTELVLDTRDQRDYPKHGMLLRWGVRFSAFSQVAGNALLRNTMYCRYSGFKPLNKAQTLVLATLINANIITGKVPYRYARQLGYQADYVRGYEPVVGDGQGFVLGKLALRKAILNGQLVKLSLPRAIKNYQQIPMSLWFNIFVDAGKVLQPYNEIVNPLSKQWYAGYGVGVDAIAWYSAMVRFDYGFNRMGKGIFNVSFKNAF